METGGFSQMQACCDKNRIIVALMLILFIFISGCVQGARQELNTAPGSNLFVPNWWTLALAGMMISVMLIVFSYMAGEAFNVASIKGFAKQEIYELLSTVIIIVFIMGALYSFGMFAKNIMGSGANFISSSTYAYAGLCTENAKVYPLVAGAPEENILFADADWFLGCVPFSSQSYMLKVEKVKNAPINFNDISAYDNKNYWDSSKSKGVLMGHMMNIYVSLFSLEMLLGPVSTFGVSAYLPEPIISSISLDIAPNAGLTPVSESMIMLTDLVGVGVGAVIVQKVLLQFVHQNAIVVFLPLGIAFKAVPILRKTGATIIAAALVMYFIYPMTIWMNQQIYFAMVDPQGTGSANPQVSHIIDWTNYQSMLEICSPKQGESQAQFEQRLANQFSSNQGLQKKSQGLVNTLINSLGTASGSQQVDVKLPESQQNALGKSFLSNTGLVADYMTSFYSIMGPVLPVEYFFEALVDQFTATMQWFVLIMLFIVNTVLICMTLFKDLSLAMGGEPRLLGISRLV